MLVMSQHAHQQFFLEDCYRDEDLGPILRGEAFREVRQRFPEGARHFGGFDGVFLDD